MPNKDGRGLFITLEGGEGSGKTSQINRLAQFLTDEGHKVITTREPGGTPEAESVRDILVQRDSGNWSPMAETLLIFAARVMHVDHVIKPALDDGKIVICDRFTDSTVAYQGYGRQMKINKIKSIQEVAIKSLEPDLTFILDLDVKAGLERSKKRLAGQKGYDQTEDRFERLDTDFHERLRNGFLQIAKNEPDRCHVIDAEQSMDDVYEHLKKITISKLADKKG